MKRALIFVLLAAGLVAAGPEGRSGPRGLGQGGPQAGAPPGKAAMGRKGIRGGRRSAEGVPKPGQAAAMGNAFLQQKSNLGAVKSFRKQLEANPEAPVLHVGLGRALARMGSCQEALDELWPQVGTGAFGHEAALASAVCSDRLGFSEDALFFARMAADLKPDNARVLTLLALDLADAGLDAEAEAVLDDLAGLRADRDASLYARATLALRRGDLDEFDIVAATWERESRPDTDLWRLQAQSWLDMDDPNAAFKLLSRIRRVKVSGHLRQLRAEAARRLGQSDDAFWSLEDRRESVMEGETADALKVRVLVDLGRIDEAEAILADYADPDDAELIASTWYLARHRGDTGAMEALAARYERVRGSPLRELDELVPLDRR